MTKAESHTRSNIPCSDSYATSRSTTTAALDPTDQETPHLVQLAQGGCAVAFTELASRFRPRLLRFLESKFPASRSDSEDVTQESLTKAWQHLARYEPKHSFSTWLYTIANRTAIDFQRRRKRSRTQSLSVLDLSVDGSAQMPTEYEQDHRLLEVKEEAENVWAIALKLLNNSQYSVLWLRYGEELSIPEIAKVLKRSQVSVRVSLHRARASLKAGMASSPPSDSDKEGKILSSAPNSFARNNGRPIE